MKYVIKYHITFNAEEEVEAENETQAVAEWQRRGHDLELEAVRNGDDDDYQIDTVEVSP